MADRFDKFTERARLVLRFALQEATDLRRDYLGPEHLLLALMRVEDGLAARILENLDVQPAQVRGAIALAIASGEIQAEVASGLTPRSQKVLQLAAEEARRLNHRYIGTEHLLIGLLLQEDGHACRALESQGVTLEGVRSEVAKLIVQGPPPRPDPASRMVEEIGAWQQIRNTRRLEAERLSHYRVESRWTGLFGALPAAAVLEEDFNRRAVEGWRLVSAVHSLGLWWCLPRGKVTYVWERLPAQALSDLSLPWEVPMIDDADPGQAGPHFTP